VAEGDYVITRGCFSGHGRPAAWIATDIVQLDTSTASPDLRRVKVQFCRSALLGGRLLRIDSGARGDTAYIRNQEEDQSLEQINLWRSRPPSGGPTSWGRVCGPNSRFKRLTCQKPQLCRGIFTDGSQVLDLRRDAIGAADFFLRINSLCWSKRAVRFRCQPQSRNKTSTSSHH
jgi:hypothetical protein